MLRGPVYRTTYDINNFPTDFPLATPLPDTFIDLIYSDKPMFQPLLARARGWREMSENSFWLRRACAFGWYTTLWGHADLATAQIRRDAALDYLTPRIALSLGEHQGFIDMWKAAHGGVYSDDAQYDLPVWTVYTRDALSQHWIKLNDLIGAHLPL